MAIREVGRNRNIFQATKGEKVAKQEPLDFTEFDKRAKEKRDVETSRKTSLANAVSQGLPERLQSNLRGQYDAINKAVSEGMDVNSSEYLQLQQQLLNDAKQAKGFWDTSLAKAKEVSKDPAKFRSLTLTGKEGDADRNPKYQSVEDGLAGFYDYSNQGSDPNQSMANILADMSGVEQDAMVGYNEIDNEALMKNADDIFASTMTQTFDVDPSGLAGVGVATDKKALYGTARDKAKAAFIAQNQDALKTMALNQGVANTNTFQNEIAEELIKKSEEQAKTMSYRTGAQEAKTKADTRKITKELEEKIPAISYVDYSTMSESQLAGVKEKLAEKYAGAKISGEGEGMDAGFTQKDIDTVVEREMDFLKRNGEDGSAVSELSETKPVSISGKLAIPSAISYKTDKDGKPTIKVLALESVDSMQKQGGDGDYDKFKSSHAEELDVDETWVINNYGQEYYDKLKETYSSNQKEDKTKGNQEEFSEEFYNSLKSGDTFMFEGVEYTKE